MKFQGSNTYSTHKICNHMGILLYGNMQRPKLNFIHRVLYGNGSFREKKEDKISLGNKLLTKLMRNVGNSNGGNLFMQKPQTRITIFKGFHLSPTATAAFKLSGFQMSSLSTAAIGKPSFTYCDMFVGVCLEDPV